MAQPTTSEPTWEIAHLFPNQGHWSEEEYILLTNGTNRLIEFSQGKIEVLPMPTRSHQLIIAYLYQVFFELIMRPGRGTVLFAALRVRLWENKIREPDIVVMLAEHRDREHEEYFDGADLVVEIVSPDNPSRDLVIKRTEYAQAGIPEYWIIEPKTEIVTVLRLQGETYVEHDECFGPTCRSTPCLNKYSINPSSTFWTRWPAPRQLPAAAALPRSPAQWRLACW